MPSPTKSTQDKPPCEKPDKLGLSISPAAAANKSAVFVSGSAKKERQAEENRFRSKMGERNRLAYEAREEEVVGRSEIGSETMPSVSPVSELGRPGQTDARKQAGETTGKRAEEERPALTAPFVTGGGSSQMPVGLAPRKQSGGVYDFDAQVNHEDIPLSQMQQSGKFRKVPFDLEATVSTDNGETEPGLPGTVLIAQEAVKPGLASEEEGTRADDVGKSQSARRDRGPDCLLRDVCALANACEARKSEALRRTRRKDDVRGTLALLEAVEDAALPCLNRNSDTGCFEVGRREDGREITTMPSTWYEAVVRKVGYKGVCGQERSEIHRKSQGKQVNLFARSVRCIEKIDEVFHTMSSKEILGRNCGTGRLEQAAKDQKSTGIYFQDAKFKTSF